MNKSTQHGVTLLELMIALVLGLLIVAAGLAVFLNAQRSAGFQGGMNDIQQNANFGLSILTQDIRHANLNMPSQQYINNEVKGSGIIFTDENILGNTNTPGIKADAFTKQSVTEDATDKKSDQLTIQFKPDVRGDGQVDCEGKKIEPNRIYIYRYYLAELPINQQIPNSLTRFGLYCDAAYYEKTGNSDQLNYKVRDLNEGGQLVLQNVDAFKVRLLVKTSDGTLSYMTINEYLNQTIPTTIADKNKYNNVIGVELGLLMTSNQAIGSEAKLNTNTQYTIAGQLVKLKDNINNSKYLHQPVTQFVGIRNTLGAS